jgi:lactoylglutathione lyase
MTAVANPAATRFHHAGLPVADLDRATAWYEEALGFTVELTVELPTDPVRVAMLVNDADVRLELFELEEARDTPAWADPVSALRRGVGHVAVVVDDLAAAFERAAAAGGRAVWEPRQSPEPHIRMAFVADPDGNLVELLAVAP